MCRGAEQTSVNDLVSNDQCGLRHYHRTLSMGPNGRGTLNIVIADVSKAERMLGWEPQVSFEEGLKLTAETIA